MGMERGWGWGRLGNDLGEEGPGLLLGGRPGARGGRARAGSACGWWNRAVIRIRMRKQQRSHDRGVSLSAFKKTAG